MKRYLLLVLPLCAAIPAHSQTKTEAKSELPLRQVVLFSSGVGYFSRSGIVDDNAVVDLNVRAPQISDLLKSLVLFDEKGTVAPVSYSINDSLGNRTTETDLQISADATPGAILKTFRGANVVLTRKAGDSIEGRIVSVSNKVVPSEKNNYTVEVVSLSTPTGLQTVDLSEVASFQLTDPKLQQKLQSALEKSVNALTSKLDDGVRSVKLRFNGKGKRNARAGYLLEMPTWKTSYRLVLEDKKEPYLQGWAVVENPTDSDWNEVGLSLVAGRPISFIQNLAAPIYISRPVVDSQIPNASPVPQTFGETFGPQIGKLMAKPTTGAPATPAFDLAASTRSRGSGIFSNAGSYNAPAALAEARNEMMPIESVQAQASGKDAGDLFVYAIDAKLTLPRGEAAMVPIVSQNVAGESITIVQSNGNNPNETIVPQNGFCLRNDSKLRLQGGPITVYNGGIYGGDALIQNVSAGEAKLIAYGLDLDTVAKLESADQQSSLVLIKSNGSQIQFQRKATYTQKYLLRNKSDKTKTIFIQQPTMTGWKLVDEKQRYEKAIDGDRFRVEVGPKKSQEYSIVWEQIQYQGVAIGDFDFGNLDYYLAQKVISPELKAKLSVVAAKKARITEIQNQIAAQNAAMKTISEDQTRLRENMRVLDKSSKLYQSYEAKLGTQEDKIVKIDAEINRLNAAKVAAQAEFQKAIETISD
jgi:hypothetical protein